MPTRPFDGRLPESRRVGNPRAEGARPAPNRLVALGATLHEPVTDVGSGIRVASVQDPFGNMLGMI